MICKCDKIKLRDEKSKFEEMPMQGGGYIAGFLYKFEYLIEKKKGRCYILNNGNRFINWFTLAMQQENVGQCVNDIQNILR